MKSGKHLLPLVSRSPLIVNAPLLLSSSSQFPHLQSSSVVPTYPLTRSEKSSLVRVLITLVRGGVELSNIDTLFTVVSSLEAEAEKKQEEEKEEEEEEEEAAREEKGVLLRQKSAREEWTEIEENCAVLAKLLLKKKIGKAVSFSSLLHSQEDEERLKKEALIELEAERNGRVVDKQRFDAELKRVKDEGLEREKRALDQKAAVERELEGLKQRERQREKAEEERRRREEEKKHPWTDLKWSTEWKSSLIQIRDNEKTAYLTSSNYSTVVMGSQKLTSGAVTVSVRVGIPNSNSYYIGVIPELPSNFDTSILHIGCGLQDNCGDIHCKNSRLVSTSPSYRSGDTVC